MAETLQLTSAARHSGAGRCPLDSDAAIREVARLAASCEPQPEYWENCFTEVLRTGVSVPQLPAVQAGIAVSDALADYFSVHAGAAVRGSDRRGYPGVEPLAQHLARLLVMDKAVAIDLSEALPRNSSEAGDGTLELMHLPLTLAGAVRRYGVEYRPRVYSLRWDHPQIEEFVGLYEDDASQCVNLIVRLDDEFMEAVRDRQPVPLRHAQAPDTGNGRSACARQEGDSWIYGCLEARSLWRRLIRLASRSPAVTLMYENRTMPASPLAYVEQADTVAPRLCQAVPGESALVVLELDLACFVSALGTMELRRLCEAVQLALRLADNLIDVLRWPLDSIKLDAIAHRRVALSIGGIGNAVAGMELDPRRFGTLVRVKQLLGLIRRFAYQYSLQLAKERNPFPGLRTRDLFALMPRPELQREVEKEIHTHATRNSHLLLVTPFAFLPVPAGTSALTDYANLLPALAVTETVGFAGCPTAESIRPRDLEAFLRLAWACSRAPTSPARSTAHTT